MATTGATDRTRADAPRRGGVRTSIRDRAHETKASWKSVEFWATVVLVVPAVGPTGASPVHARLLGSGRSSSRLA
jgi:hypothetical protein